MKLTLYILNFYSMWCVHATAYMGKSEDSCWSQFPPPCGSWVSDLVLVLPPAKHLGGSFASRGFLTSRAGEHNQPFTACLLTISWAPGSVLGQRTDNEMSKSLLVWHQRLRREAQTNREVACPWCMEIRYGVESRCGKRCFSLGGAVLEGLGVGATWVETTVCCGETAVQSPQPGVRRRTLG